MHHENEEMIRILSGNHTRVSDEHNLLDKIILHHVTGRALYSIQNGGRSECFSKTFINQLAEAYAKTYRAVQKNITTIVSVSNYLPSEDSIVIIKGFATHYLKQNKYIVRSGDIDVLTKDYKELFAILQNENYAQTREEFMHEAGEYSKNKIEIDVHKFFPIYRYHYAIYNEFENKRACHDLLYEPISYTDLLEYAVDLRDSKCKIPDANMMMIIICSHAFMNYTNMWSISHRGKSYIKLGEMLELYDLVTHKTFHIKTFLRLLEKYKAHDAVKWSITILMKLFGKNPLSAIFDDDELEKLGNDLGIKFPRCLWWGIWINAPIGIRDLLNRDWFSFNSLYGIIHFNAIEVKKWYCIDQFRDSLFSVGENVILYKFSISLCKQSKQYTVKIQLDHTCWDGNFRIDFGNMDACEIKMREGKFVSTGKRSKVFYDQNKNIIHITMSTEKLYKDMLLGVSKHEKIKVIASTLVPLSLTISD